MKSPLAVVVLGAAPALAPPETTDWRAVALTAGATAVVIASFLLAIKHAGKAAR